MTKKEKEADMQDLKQEEVEVEALKLQIVDLQDKLLRSNAENENMRRRYEKQIDETRDYSIANLCRDLISVMDNLSRALAHKPKDLDEHMQNFISGVEMTKTELGGVFAKYGIEEIAPGVGEKFDYNSHHAIAKIVSDEHPESTVLQLMQTGYRIKDRLLRAAAVSVAKKTE
jgi:molecular chaperone GrpE